MTSNDITKDSNSNIPEYTSDGDKIITYYDNGKSGIEHIQIIQIQPKIQSITETSIN